MSKDFAAYLYLTTTPTDSAAAATALASGRKTYNNAINWSNDDRPMRGETIAEIAKSQGKSVGRHHHRRVERCDPGRPRRRA